ncbi:MAG: hypothetical protein KDE28_01290, partial [Anaerolineales bacterium]|nr:hypothetical protein [Anaerolineales bacterium]
MHPVWGFCRVDEHQSGCLQKAKRLVRRQIEYHANLFDVIPSFACREKRSLREREGPRSKALAGPAGGWFLTNYNLKPANNLS